MAKVVEWQEYGEEILFWKWKDSEIRRGSKLIIHPGQDAIFLCNGKVEGIFRDEGSFDIESQILPGLASLAGFRFGFGNVLRAEVLFINTKELTVKWGTKNAINVPVQGLPGGMPIRSFGTFNCRVDDEEILIEKIAGIRQEFRIDDVKERVVSKLDQLLMKWIVQIGGNLYQLQTAAEAVARGIKGDLDYEMRKIGIAITDFVISSFTYPEDIQKAAEAQASLYIISGEEQPDLYAQAAGNVPQGAAQTGAPQNAGTIPNFCPNCGARTSGTRFCPNCGNRLA